jgi:hypothetical protein
MITALQWTREDWEQIGKSIGFIFLSFLFFWALQYAVRWYLFGKCTFRTFSYFKFVQKRRKQSKSVPDSQSLQVVPPNKKWRISNECVSLIHSVISGIWALYACVMFPKLMNEHNFTHDTPKALVYLSFGYLVHDLIDLLVNERSVRIIELLFHHVIVITAFIVTLTSHLFLGLVMFGLLMELNSIFLHTRSLLNLYRQPKKSTAFKFVALLNVATFMVFRMSVSVYLVYWQLTNALQMRWYLAVVTFVVTVSLLITNSVLCYRVLAADGLLGKKRQSRPADVPPVAKATLRTLDETEDDLNTDDDNSSSDAEDVENGKIEHSSSKRLRSQGTDPSKVDECVGTDENPVNESCPRNGLLKTNAPPNNAETLVLNT